jgi:AMP nucleosidase
MTHSPNQAPSDAEIAETITQIQNQLRTHFRTSVDALKADIAAFVADGTPPPADALARGMYNYPALKITATGTLREGVKDHNLSFGRIDRAGEFVTSITRPDLFGDYIAEQLGLILRHYAVRIEVVASHQAIPFPYVLDPSGSTDMGGVAPLELARHFPTTDLAHIGDELADGLFGFEPGAPQPLALFDALRTDFSLARLRHYTGTAPEHFQRYILFTNYHRYVDEFVRWAAGQVGQGQYSALAGAAGLYVDTPGVDASQQVADSAWRKHQMPAYHLIAPDGQGISLVNIGVGPSNAKTICDHLAVLRPEAWLMIGHCGGLRASQRIGDYVLAHAYLRDDHILDSVLPPEIPIPPIAEVQQALAQAAGQVSGETGADLKRRMRTGTVVTTDDRNWELRFTDSALRFSQSRAIGIDMESATIAAQGYRFRVPYGTLLCVSDKPLHGELKLPGQANRFYEEAIAAHLQIGIRACEYLRDEGAKLHSRKLRAFNEPPFR